MIHCAVYSNGIVVKCAHSASNRAISDFACSVLFGALPFFGFFAFAGKEMPMGVCVLTRGKTDIFAF